MVPGDTKGTDAGKMIEVYDSDERWWAKTGVRGEQRLSHKRTADVSSALHETRGRTSKKGENWGQIVKGRMSLGRS